MKTNLNKIASCIVGISTLMLLSLPQEVYACACCANAGEWSQTTQAISNFEFKEISSLRFGNSAKLYTTARGESDGIASNSSKFGLSLTKKQRVWNFAFKDDKGKTGTLSITIPQRGVQFKTDLYDTKNTDPLLYKELRLEGNVTGTGIFAQGMTRDAKYRLVLQGRGGSCFNAGDFKTWNLQVFGSKANFAFYSPFAK